MLRSVVPAYGRRWFCSVLLLLLWMPSWPAGAASRSDVDNAIAQLSTQLPSFRLKVELSKTFSRAYITEHLEGPILTLDPEFMSSLSNEALLFVMAHEYAHVQLGHQKKLGAKAVELAGLPSPDLAYDALETQPAAMAALHHMNRQFELDADEMAVKWLKGMGINACVDDILRTMDNNEMAMMVVSPSHPGYYRRKSVICRASG